MYSALYADTYSTVSCALLCNEETTPKLMKSVLYFYISYYNLYNIGLKGARTWVTLLPTQLPVLLFLSLKQQDSMIKLHLAEGFL